MTGQSHHTDAQQYLPGMGKHWLLPLYDPFSRLAGIGRIHGQLMDRANLRSDQRILEIGCGTGNLLTALGRRLRDIDALGIDPDPAALRRPAARPPGTGCRSGTSRRSPARCRYPTTASTGCCPRSCCTTWTTTSAPGRYGRPGGCCAAAVSCTCSTSTAPPPGGAARRRARVAASLPERVLAALADTGLDRRGEERRR